MCVGAVYVYMHSGGLAVCSRLALRVNWISDAEVDPALCCCSSTSLLLSFSSRSYQFPEASGLEKCHSRDNAAGINTHIDPTVSVRSV